MWWSSTSSAASGSVGDAASSRAVLAIMIALILLGLALIALAWWVFKRTRPETEVLGPLEVMGGRSYRQADEVRRAQLLAAVRPSRPDDAQAAADHERDDAERVPVAAQQDARPVQAAVEQNEVPVEAAPEPPRRRSVVKVIPRTPVAASTSATESAASTADDQVSPPADARQTAVGRLVPDDSDTSDDVWP